MPNPISLAAHAAYDDLLAAHLARPAPEAPGSPFLRRMKQGAYWYARQRLGERVVDTYLGPDTEAMRARVAALEAAGEADRAFEMRTAKLVAQLRAAGLPTMDRGTGKVVSAMARVGVFRRGGVLVGTHAFRLYGGELGVTFDSQAVRTLDVDVAAFSKGDLQFAMADEASGDLAAALLALGLQPQPSLDGRKSSQWRAAAGDAAVDFLTPLAPGSDRLLRLESLAVDAQPLPFMDYLIETPISAVALYRGGILVRIPRPERFAIHKLIVAARRRADGLMKRRKDLAQAEALIEVLAEDRPGELAGAYAEAREKGPAWRAALDESLAAHDAIAQALR